MHKDLLASRQGSVCCSKTPSQDSFPAERIRPVTFCWQDALFNHQAQPATSQHGQIPQTAHFTTAAQTVGIYSWWARSVGARALMYVESHSHALPGVNSEASHSRGVSQPQYCLERDGGWGRRSVGPYTTQLEEDTPWRDWLRIKYHREHFQ